MNPQLLHSERFIHEESCDEFHRIMNDITEEGIWIADVIEPFPIDLPIDEQVKELVKRAYLVECNLAFTEMHGYTDSRDVIGIRRFAHLDLTDSHNNMMLRTFVGSPYEIHNAEMHEIDRNSIDHHVTISVIGAVESQHLKRIFGVEHCTTNRAPANMKSAELFSILTPRERDILKLTCAQLTIREIADVLRISPKTVDTHRVRLMNRLDIHDLVGLTLLAVRLGLAEDASSVLRR